MIQTMWGALTFINPWVLSGLIFLPALWFLLRVTPPVPRLVYFPPAHLLAGLVQRERTPRKTPWWILLLRLVMAALVIMALAGPLLNPATALPGSGALRLVIDNSWPSAQTWPRQMAEAQSIISRAARENRNLYIITTAPEAGRKAPLAQGPLTAAQADSLLRGLAPLPWPANYAAMDEALQNTPLKDQGTIQTLWLGHGLGEGDADAVMRSLLRDGAVAYQHPENNQLPLLLRAGAEGAGAALSARIYGPAAMSTPQPVTVQAVAADGRVLDSITVTLDPARQPAEARFDLPESVRAQVASLRIRGRESAGSIALTEDRYRNRIAGIVTMDDGGETAPLINAAYYIRRALENSTQIQSGDAEGLIEGGVSVMILPDIGALPPGTLDALDDWVTRGGLLLRFAGPNMTQGDQFLTPVPLRRGGRALDGDLTWEKPVKLAPFPENSPFYGLTIPEDIIVNRQILAQPVEGMEQKTWATLEDGTPLITAAPHGNGLLVMVHTTATPEWSDLALSGLFVKMLERVITISPGTAMTARAGGTLQPLLVMDGYGALTQPLAHVEPLPAEIPASLVPDSSHPPGIYGRAGLHAVFNIGDRVSRPIAMPAPPAGISSAVYGDSGERDLAPLLLTAAFTLFLFDWLLMMILQIGFSRFTLRRGAAVIVILCALSLLSATAAHAQNNPQDLKYAAHIHLAYIKTGSAEADRTAFNGLEALADVLRMRTSVEPAGVVALDPERDELAFYPLIYWPIAADSRAISDTAIQRIQNYINHGGTILVDTRDRQSQTAGSGRNAATLRALLGGLDIPPLTPMKDDHVLGKAFYLMSSFPGRYDGGTLWVEERSADGRDGVSSVIIGSHDWAAAWATMAGGRATDLGGGARQQELAARFGVNVVMYALTGNYKADQVHLPHILERLGQ